MRQHDILDYRGSWLLLDFMETDCPECKQLSVKLEAVKKKHGAKVGILSIVITPPETQATVAKYVAETKITTPIVFDLSQVAISYFKATPQNPDLRHASSVRHQPQWPDREGLVPVRRLQSPGDLDQLIGTAAKKQVGRGAGFSLRRRSASSFGCLRQLKPAPGDCRSVLKRRP